MNARKTYAGPIALAAVAMAVNFGAAPSAVGDTNHYVRTVSGQVRCLVLDIQVTCEHGPSFPQSPEGEDLAVVTSDGNFHWDSGNIGGAHYDQDVVLAYGQSFKVNGWTIEPSNTGTRFANSATGHGMFVSVENVYAF